MRWCLFTLVVAGFSLAAAGRRGVPRVTRRGSRELGKCFRTRKTGGAPDEAIKDLKWVITGDKITYKVGDKTTELTYKLDPTKKPKWIDFTRGGRTTTLGIYDLEGDNLKICFPKGDKGKRSTAFESKPKSGNEILIILKREKP